MLEWKGTTTTSTLRDCKIGVVPVAQPCSRLYKYIPFGFVRRALSSVMKKQCFGRRFDAVRRWLRTRDRQTTSRTWIDRAAIVNKL
jgi:hypothetical protein